MKDNRPVVKSLEQTCEACPSQWEGEFEDGSYFYIRYRWGRLRAGKGHSLSEAIQDQDTYVTYTGDCLSGYLSQKEMITILSEIFNFNKLA